MSEHRCVLLADRHHGLAEGMRSLLETTFGVVVMVADEASLYESAERLKPTVAVVDLALVQGENLEGLKRLRFRCPDLKLLVISVHDEPGVREKVMRAGADAFIVKRDIATNLLPAIDVLLGEGGGAATGTDH